MSIYKLQDESLGNINGGIELNVNTLNMLLNNNNLTIVQSFDGGLTWSALDPDIHNTVEDSVKSNIAFNGYADTIDTLLSTAGGQSFAVQTKGGNILTLT